MYKLTLSSISQNNNEHQHEEEDHDKDINIPSQGNNGVYIDSLIDFFTGSLLRYTNENDTEPGNSEPALMEEEEKEMISMD